jgi:hypothetical protein
MACSPFYPFFLLFYFFYNLFSLKSVPSQRFDFDFDHDVIN